MDGNRQTENVKVELPADLEVEIFSRLPAKPIGRFRALSKYWNTFLSTTQFLNQHLAARLKTLALTNQENVMLRLSGEDGFHHFCAVSCPMTDEESKTLIPIDHNVCQDWEAMSIDGSCNGLILVTDGSYYMEGLYMLLVNPTTREIVYLPKFSYPPLRPRPVAAGIGFGYDSVTKDYKVVRLCWASKPDERYVDVYSVKGGGAVSVDNSGFGELSKLFYFGSNGAFANGSLHWLVGNKYLTLLGENYITKYTSIGAFDLNAERFSLIGLPVEFDTTSIGLFTCGMNVHGGCLCVMNNFAEGGMDMWVMKEYKVADSWVKLRIHQPNDIEFGRFFIYTLCSVGDHKLLSISTLTLELLLTSFKEGTSKTVAFDELPNVAAGYHYIDTLVSLNNHMSAQHYEEMAESYEEQLKMRQASLCYKIAADLYQSEDQSKANQCMDKFSQFQNQPDL